MPRQRIELKIAGSDLWYLVGVIASDGCLSSDGRHINITSKDFDFLKAIKDKLGIINKIGTKNKGRVNLAHYLEFSNRNLYEFLLSVGLTPNKSLSLKDLNIPEGAFVDFFRGLVDGDGCIRRWIHPTNDREQWSLRVYSGSRQFVDWLDNAVEHLLKVRGRIHKNSNNTWVLKYGKMAAREISRQCYYVNCFGLQRKIKLAQACADSYMGWSRGKTIVPLCS